MIVCTDATDSKKLDNSAIMVRLMRSIVVERGRRLDESGDEIDERFCH